MRHVKNNQHFSDLSSRGNCFLSIFPCEVIDILLPSSAAHKSLFALLSGEEMGVEMGPRWFIGLFGHLWHVKRTSEIQAWQEGTRIW